jgi:hypothetical protein
VTAFVNSLDQMPDLDAICAGAEVSVPRRSTCNTPSPRRWSARPSAPEKTTRRRAVIGNILAYAGRFPQREMGVMLVSDLHRAIGNDLFEVPAFADWARPSPT